MRQAYKANWYRANAERLKVKAREYHLAHKVEAASAKLKKNYGITIDDYQDMFSRQDGRCAICGQKTKLHVDHDHVTFKVRGLLCQNCNRGLGLFRDDAHILQSAVEYIDNGGF